MKGWALILGTILAFVMIDGVNSQNQTQLCRKNFLINSDFRNLNYNLSTWTVY